MNNLEAMNFVLLPTPKSQLRLSFYEKVKCAYAISKNLAAKHQPKFKQPPHRDRQ